MSRNQAEAHVKIIAEIVEEDLATKQDLKDLEYRLTIKLGAIAIASSSLIIAAVTLLVRHG